MPAPAIKLPGRVSGGASSLGPPDHSEKGVCGFFSRVLAGAVDHVENTPAVLEAKAQPKPCGVGRYFLLVVYVIYAFLTARVYFAWPNLSNLLFRSNAYSWLCDSYLADGKPDMRLDINGGKRYICEEQNSAVGNIFVTCLAFAFSFSLAAGLLLDYLGPRITATIGQVMNALAWILLAFGSESSQTYYAAFIFMGIGSDIGYLPLLSAANLFPGHEGLIVAILGASKSASFAVPTILDKIEAGYADISLRNVCLGYAALGPGLCLILAFVLVPYKHFKPWNEFTEIEEGGAYHHPIQRVNDSFASIEAHAWRDSFSSFHEGQWPLHAHDGHSGGSVSEPGRRGKHFLEVPRPGPLRSGLRKKTLTPSETAGTEKKEVNGDDERQRTEAAPVNAEQVEDVPAIYQATRMSVERGGAGNAETLNQLAETKEERPVSFVRQFISSYAICIVVYSILKAIMYAFFTTAAENLLGKQVNDFMGAALPFSLFPCIVIGKVVDMVGIMPILFFLNTCIALAYGSQSYCFVSDTFSSSHFGKIVGTIHLIAGFLSLLKIPMQKLVVDVFHSVYYYPCLIMLMLCGINYAVLLVLLCKKRANPHPFWPQAAREVARQEAEEKKRLAQERKEQKANAKKEKQQRELELKGTQPTAV
ncbi:uncharacterized protein LOC34618810 [Cyclospora cayetanensis]|uniref:Uncharacterized protein LOC34618810 n=1 Tax=Cyclospora cayetanensis TaxID=88456 RepID=A0A6P6RX65_9EIME|nr:uncharacterized protein LOC34618810 [Cyclospora cayetanensis]